MDKHIPIPPRQNQRGRVLRDKYGFSQMEIGDSFFTPTVQSTMAGIASRYADRYGTRYTTRKTTENGIHGVRVWRIK